MSWSDDANEYLDKIMIGLVASAAAYGLLLEIDGTLLYIAVPIVAIGLLIWGWIEGHLDPLIEIMKSDSDEPDQPSNYSPFADYPMEEQSKSSIERLKEWI